MVQIPSTVTTVDMQTGKRTERPFNWTLMPLKVKEGECPECGGAHAEEEPHNRDNLHYQYLFYGRHGRWPTWLDAMAHCTPETIATWKQHLTALKVWSEPDAG